MTKKLSEIKIKECSIDEELYKKYEVKRGLRNKDGSGVLVGLTEIGTAVGYKVVESDVVPVDGQLYYRNYNVLDLVKGFLADKRLGFEETGYLLLYGKLPTSEELQVFNEELTKLRKLPDNFKDDMICKFQGNDVMNMLARSVLILYALDDNPDDTSPENIIRQCINLIAKFPVITAYSYQAIKHGCAVASFYQPENQMGAAETFLHLIRGDKYTKLEVEILDLMLMLHAEHGGGNNSSFTTRVVSSSGSDTYSVIAAALGSLKGPLHGGASQKAREMFLDIMENVKNWDDEKEVEEYLRKIMEKKAFNRLGKIYGLGHSVYTLSDPRRVVLKEKARELAKEKGREKELQLYENVEKIGPEVIYSIKGKAKKIAANVDFYSGFIYDCLGLPPELYTALFANGRILGWSAHRIEEMISARRIIRPSYKCVSPREEYVEMNKR